MGDLLPGSAPGPSQPAGSIGEGQVKVGLILPLSGSGARAVVAQSMRNAADMALAEFPGADIQLLVKDDGGSAPGAQQAAQQVLDEGAEIILGPPFGLTVGPVGQLARARNIPVIAFSTDANVAARGVYLLSFLPESDVDRIIGYAVSQGRRSFAALDSGQRLRHAWSRRRSSSRWRAAAAASSRSSAIRSTRRRCRVRCATSRRRRDRPRDAIFIPDGAEGAGTAVQTLIASGIDTKRVQSSAAGLWEDPQIFYNPQLEGAWYAGPDPTGFRNFSGRYQEPLRQRSRAHRLARL